MSDPDRPRASDVVDPSDPRAPSDEIWDAMTDEERRAVVDALPSDPGLEVAPPEGVEGDRVRASTTRAPASPSSTS